MSAICCRKWLNSDVTNPLKMKVNEWFATWLPGQFEELTKLREGQAALQQQVSCTRASSDIAACSASIERMNGTAAQARSA